MTKVADLAEQAPKILIYGPPGTGKTALALTMGANAQVVDLDDGLRTGVTLKDNFTDARRAVDVKRYIEAAPHQRASVFKQAKECLYDISNQINQKKYPFDALIIDCLSSFAGAAVAQIMYNSGQIGAAPQLQHWGLAFIEITNVIAVVRAMPIPVVLLAHDQQKGDADDEKTSIGIPGRNMPSMIARYFDEVWYMRVKELGGGKVDYVIQTKSTSKITCRTRSNIPDMTSTSCGMWELIKRCGYVPPQRKVEDAKPVVGTNPVVVAGR